MKHVTASIRAPADGTTELTVRTVTAVPVKRSTTRVIRDVFPPGTWAKADPDKIRAEYQYLRAAAGYCRMCPAKRERYKHRCNACQAKERERWRAQQSVYNAARKPTLRTVVKRPRRSKFRFAAQKWLRLRRKKEL